MRITERDEKRLHSMTAPPNEQGCMLWLGSVSRSGYGRMRLDGKNVQAHRVSYTLAYGPISEGLQLDHLCRVRHCVAPDHLEAVTNAENTRRGVAGAQKRAQTHCGRGHEFSEQNTRIRTNGTRVCRACALLAVHKHRRRKRGASL